MYKKGQFQIISIFMQVLIVLFFLGTGLGEVINTFTQNAITSNNMTGVTAFLLAYMNLWIILGLFLVVSIGTSFVGGNQ
jgi:hypothetical protein